MNFLSKNFTSVLSIPQIENKTSKSDLEYIKTANNSTSLKE